MALATHWFAVTVKLNGVVGLRCLWIRQPGVFYVVAGFSKSCCCSVTESCLTLSDPMDCGMPGLPILHYVPEFAQIHVH